ncbi:MAG: peptide chain release factor 1 [Gammaproteobacteria bacterium]
MTAAKAAKRIDEARKRLAVLESSIGEGGTNVGALMREHGKLSPMVKAADKLQALKARILATESELAELRADPELRAVAEAELAELRAAENAANDNLQQILAPEEDAADARGCLLEIRAAVGGNESCLFAADLLRMYAHFAESQKWQLEHLSSSNGIAGGYKESITRISGNRAYGKLKYESGAHRVQRVPATESQGRVHTSVVTIAVLAEASAEDGIVLLPNDLRIETFRASGAGGQHVNTTDSAVRITHLPTGVVAECQDERSQHKNREKAAAVLKARITDRRRREQLEKETSERRKLVGSGDRSERIRTYNFPQGRMTDHRIGLTLYKLSAIMEGDIGGIIDALAKADRLECGGA